MAPLLTAHPSFIHEPCGGRPFGQPLAYPHTPLEYQLCVCIRESEWECVSVFTLNCEHFALSLVHAQRLAYRGMVDIVAPSAQALIVFWRNTIYGTVSLLQTFGVLGPFICLTGFVHPFLVSVSWFWIGEQQGKYIFCTWQLASAELRRGLLINRKNFWVGYSWTYGKSVFFFNILFSELSVYVTDLLFLLCNIYWMHIFPSCWMNISFNVFCSLVVSSNCCLKSLAFAWFVGYGDSCKNRCPNILRTAVVEILLHISADFHFIWKGKLEGHQSRDILENGVLACFTTL